MQIILQIITLVSCCSNSFQNLSLSDENKEMQPSLTNPTFECTTGDLNKKPVDETIKFQEKIKKIDKLCSAQSKNADLIISIFLNISYNLNNLYSRACFKLDTENNTEEVTKETFEAISKEETKELSEKVTKEMSEEVTEEMSPKVSEEVTKEMSEEESANSNPESLINYLELARNMTCINDSINSCLVKIRKFKEGSIDEKQLKSHLKESKREMLKHLNYIFCEERIKRVSEYEPTTPHKFELEDFKFIHCSLIFMLNAYKANIQEILNEFEE